MADTIAELASLLKLGPDAPLQPPRFAKVVSVAGDAVTVTLGASAVEAVRCCLTKVGDVVLLETMPSGQLAAVAVKGEEASAQITYDLAGSVSDHTFDVTLNDSGGGSDTASLTLAAGANVSLSDSGSTITISATDTTYSAATQSAAGLMSAADKAKLDGIEAGATAITVDSALDSTSTNPVENKAIVTALAGKQDTLTAGTGLSMSGSTINHSNATTAGTVGTSSATSGNTLAVPYVTFDAQGHKTAMGTHTHSITGVSWYGTCDTAYGTQDKVVVCADFAKTVGSTIAVRFSKGSESSGMRLNVNGTGAFWVHYNGAMVSGTNIFQFQPNATVTFMWDGTQYQVVSIDDHVWARTPWFFGDSFVSDAKALVRPPYINWFLDGFWQLRARGATVTMTVDGVATTISPDVLFDGSYDSKISTVADGSTAVLTIDFSTMSTGWFPEVGTYPYGDIYISFYYRCGAASLTARGYTDYNSIGWKTLTCTDLTAGTPLSQFTGTKWRIDNPGLYHLKTLEITYVGKASGTTPAGSSMSAIELNLVRPTMQMVPVVTKYAAQTLYDRLTAPQFKGVFEGNSSWYGTCSTAAGTAAKVVSCSGFVLAKGAVVHVYSSNANTVANITLNVNSTGAKSVSRNGSSGAAPQWAAKEICSYVYDGTYWRYLGSNDASTYQLPASGVTADTYGPTADATPAFGATFEVPEVTVDAKGRVTDAETHTVTVPSLPDATSSTKGVVQPDNQSIIVSNGVLTATPAAVGLTCTERKGGEAWEYYLNNAATAWANYTCGWREEAWNDGRLTVWYWGWYSLINGAPSRTRDVTWTFTPTQGPQLGMDMPTAFVDTPTPHVSVLAKPYNTTTYSNTNFTLTDFSPNTSVSFHATATADCRAAFCVRMDGHWWLPNVDPDDPTPAEEWAIGDAIAIGGTSYYPVTDWTVSSSGAGGDSRLKAAVRFLITTSSTSGSWHVYAQYAAWTDTGYVPTANQNSYMLIRKLASAITTYTNDAGVKSAGDVWSTLNVNQRQGYVYNGQVSGNLIWGNTPYIITDCGTVGNGVTVSSETFYVGTTEVSSGVYVQTSVSVTTTTPSN